MRNIIGQHDTTIRRSESPFYAGNAVGPVPDRQPPIFEASSRLAQAVETLASELGGLSSRLNPVLGTDFPPDNSEARVGYSVPLADSIAAEASRVEAMIAHVRSLGARLGL